MLKTIGVKTIDELVNKTIPASIRSAKKLKSSRGNERNRTS
jgi:glycine cleavage system pyridoxal-binding protein P